MQAYLNDPELKLDFVKQMKADIAHERLISGTGWDAYRQRGCFVGCLIREYSHAKFPEVLGLPVWLAHLCDTLFEEQDKEDRQEFAVKFLESVQVGADYDAPNLKGRISAFFLDMAMETLESSDCAPVLKKRVSDCCQESKRLCLHGGTEAEWEAATRVAEREAESAGWAAEGAVVRKAAWMAADVAEYGHDPAAERASAADAASAAEGSEDAAYKRIADKLCELLKEV